VQQCPARFLIGLRAAHGKTPGSVFLSGNVGPRQGSGFLAAKEGVPHDRAQGYVDQTATAAGSGNLKVPPYSVAADTPLAGRAPDRNLGPAR